MRTIPTKFPRDVEFHLAAWLTFLCLAILAYSPHLCGQISAQHPAPASGHWKTEESKDAMTDRASLFADVTVHGQPRGQFTVKAWCNENQGLFFHIESHDRDLVIRRAAVDPYLNYLGGQLMDPPMSRGETPNGPQRSCAHLRVRVGEGDARQFVSTQCDDNKNLSFAFLGDTTKPVAQQIDAIGKLYSVGMDPRLVEAFNHLFPNFSDRLAKYGAQQTDSATPRMTRMGDVLSADSMRVELSFTEGPASVILLNLKDPGFRDFASHCVAPPGEAPAASDYAAAAAERARQAEVMRNAQISNFIAKADNEYSTGDYDGAITDYGKALSLDQQDDQHSKDALAGSQKAQGAKRRRDEIVAQQTAAGEWVQGTRLMWATRDNGEDINWKQANQYCVTLRTGGFSDWRLPSIDELKGLYDPPLTRNAVPSGSTRTGFDGLSSSTPYQIKGGIALTGLGVWSGTSKDGFKDLMWWAAYTNRMQAWDTIGGKKGQRALCVRPYDPALETATASTFQTVGESQSIPQRQPTEATGSPIPAAAPSLAESYYRQGEGLVGQATYDTKTGKTTLPQGCVEAFQKYLELAPDGTHAKEVKSILIEGGVPVTSN